MRTGVLLLSIKNIVATINKKEQTVSYIWIKEKREGRLIGVYDTGDGMLRNFTYPDAKELRDYRELSMVNGIPVLVGKSERVQVEVKRRWVKNKGKKEPVLDKLRERYALDLEGKKRLIRIRDYAEGLRDKGQVTSVQLLTNEVQVVKGTIKYVFGVNYGVAMQNGKEQELFEFVPHKESMRTAKDKCIGLGTGVWITELINMYDLRRKVKVRV